MIVSVEEVEEEVEDVVSGNPGADMREALRTFERLDEKDLETEL
jgi:hypothetical protein